MYWAKNKLATSCDFLKTSTSWLSQKSPRRIVTNTDRQYYEIYVVTIMTLVHNALWQ